MKRGKALQVRRMNHPSRMGASVIVLLRITQQISHNSPWMSLRLLHAPKASSTLSHIITTTMWQTWFLQTPVPWIHSVPYAAWRRSSSLCFPDSTRRKCSSVNVWMCSEVSGKKLHRSENQELSSQQCRYQNLGYCCLGENRLMGRELQR